MMTTIPKLTRREFFTVGMVGVAGYHLLSILKPSNVQASSKVEPRGGAEICVLIFLGGGPSQVDTFDLREGSWTPEDFDIRTVESGLRMPVGLLPNLSYLTDKYCIVRSVQTWEIDHGRGSYYVQAGRLFSQSRVKEIPSVGALIAYESAERRRASDFLPPFISMNVAVGPGMQLVGPGVLPSGYGPMALSTSDTPPFVVPSQEQNRFQRRLQMLRDLDAGSRNQDSERGRLFEQIRENYRGAYPLLTHPRVAEVFKTDSEESQRYGSSAVGDACLLARNVIQEGAGTRFILIHHGGWDLHRSAYDKTRKSNQYTQCKELDSALSSFLKDLESRTDSQGRRLVDKVFLTCMGEFGRTPGPLSTNYGRDHYRDAGIALFAGAGVKGGRILGGTDETGARIVDPGWNQKRPIHPEDILVTMYSAMGIDWTKKVTQTPSGRPFDYIENISPKGYLKFREVSELFA